MRIYLLRHGESEANAALSDAADCGLTERGRGQAAAAADALKNAGVGCVLSSPYRRCLETTEIIRCATGAAAEMWPAVHEHHHDPFPPGTWPLPGRDDLAKAWPNFAVPADMPPVRWAAVPEDRARQWQRLLQAVAALLERFGARTDSRVVVVTHQAPASVFVQAFCQWHNPLDVRVHIDLGSITVLEVDADGRRHVVCSNWRPQAPE
ncbi:MAG TPA: histidine phosphatase family protein [Phycisphaerae bacterium]|nr:histidine phosphatase family protein [Phycisphaerae bacterium]